MNLNFDNNWRKTLSPESSYSGKCEKTCLDKGVEKKDENIPMSLWNQCLGNCEREREEKQKATWSTVGGFLKDVRWGDIASGIFGKKDTTDTGLPSPPPEKEGISVMGWVGIIGLILVFILVIIWLFGKLGKTGKKNE